MPMGPFRVAVIAVAMLGSAWSAEAAGRKLVLEDFFRGHLIAHGTFTNNWDGSHRGVRVDMRGRWDGKVLTLIENFAYADGERSSKTWTFIKTGEGRYIGHREDLIGTAEVFEAGNDVRLDYVARQAGKNGGTYDLAFHDRLIQTAGNEVVNLADVGLLFVTIGQVELKIRRVGR